jgi:hypothetical protein
MPHTNGAKFTLMLYDLSSEESSFLPRDLDACSCFSQDWQFPDEQLPATERQAQDVLLGNLHGVFQEADIKEDRLAFVRGELPNLQ